MTEKRKVRGLFDAMDAEVDGVEWELEPSLGLGLGATEDAKRWAEIGREAERLASLSLDHLRSPKRGRGQPPKPQELTNDAQRAFTLYMTARCLRDVAGVDRDATIEIPLRRLIEIANSLFPTGDLFRKPTAENKMYECVKRGRIAPPISASR